MKKKLNFKKVFGVGASALMALSLAFGMCFSDFSSGTKVEIDNPNSSMSVEGGGTDKEVNGFSASTNTLIPDSATKLNTYTTGDTFWYTDYASGVKLGGGDTSVATDRIVKTVDNTKAKGSIDNPWVIDSKTDWTNFAAYAKKSSRCAGEVFVLNRDLDYESKAIESVEKFSGWFLGGGYTISNVKYNSYTNLAVGLFCYVSGSSVYFSDLTVKNVSVVATYPQGGGLVGHSDATNIKIASVTVTGSFTVNSVATTILPLMCGGANYVNWGGIMGQAHGANTSINLYKCATDVDITCTVTTNDWVGLGSLIACGDGVGNGGVEATGNKVASSKEINIYDCYGSANVVYNGNANVNQLWTGLLAFVRVVEKVTVQRCLSVYNLKVTGSTNYLASGLVLTEAQKYPSISSTADNYVLKDIFGYGNFSRNGTLYAMPLVGKHSTETHTSASVTNCKIFSDNGKNFYNDTTGSSSGNYIAQMGAATNASPAANLDAFKEAVKGTLNNPAVWSTDAIDQINGVTDTPDITEMPVVVSKTRITFSNQDGTLIALAGGGSNPREYEILEGGITAFPTPASSPTGKSFVGWSLDKTSDATVHNIFPKNLYGNVTMFPVWNMTGISVVVAATVKEGSATLVGDAITANYVGEPVVTLKANISNKPAQCDLSKCTVTWSWYKNEGGNEVKLDETSDTLVLTELTNASYYAKVKVVANEELWRTDPNNDVKSNGFNISIAKGKLSPVGGITLMEKFGEVGQEKDVYAYWGQPLSELKDKVAANMQNTAGSAVAGSITWKTDNEKVDSVQKTYQAFFHPADREHYADDTPIDVTIMPTVLQRIYEFRVSEDVTTANMTFAFNEEYGATYTKAQIAEKFEEAYFEWLNGMSASDGNYSAMVGRMPYFEETTPITQYRVLHETAAYFDAAHVADDDYIIKTKEENKAPTAVLKIPVVFNSKENSAKFTVTLFKTEKNGQLQTTTQSLGYGSTIDKPASTLFVKEDGTAEENGTWFLTGWFTSLADGSVPADKAAWDFTNDRVSGAMYITAEWLKGYLKLTQIEAHVNGNRIFTARNVAKPSEFIVTGTYTVYASEQDAENNNPQTDASGSPQTVLLTLSPDDYTVRANETGKYHVYNPTMENGEKVGTDTVTVKAKGENNKEVKAQTVQVKVKPMTVDMSGINFPNQSFPESDGEVQFIKKAEIDFKGQDVSATDYGGEASIQYRYHDNSGKYLNTNGGVSAVGTYYVHLTFDLQTDDLIMEPIVATFTITEKAIEVVVEWNTEERHEYTFNGQVQHPEATFRRKDDNSPVTITFVYTGSFEQMNANAEGAYSTVGVSLRNARYMLAADAASSISFRITKAIVKLPELTNNSFEYRVTEYDIAQYISGYDADMLEHLVDVQNGKYANVPGSGTIVSNVVLRDTANSQWEDGTTTAKSLTWTITPKIMTVPTFTETLIYNGETYKVAEHLNFYDPVITVYGAETEASNAGMYRVNLRLPAENAGKNYIWDNSEFNGTIEWQIRKAELYLTWDGWSYLYNGNTYSPRAEIAFGLADADADLINSANKFIYTGDADKREPGSYKVEVLISQSSDLFKNYTIAKDSSVFYWVIKENANEVVITVVWDLPADGGYTFNDAIQAPKVKALYSESGMGAENLDDYEIVYTGDWNKSKWRGSYTVGVEIKAFDGTPIRVRQGECSYVIRRNNGQGDPPTTEPTEPENPDNKGDNPSEGTVWLAPQTIISAVSLVLLVVFTIMTLNYVSVMNEAKKKTKKLAQISYSFAPAGLLALAFGLSSGAWWGVAAALASLAIFMCALMFVYRGKSKKALLALAEEQERVDEEKEAAREAQQQRRDDEFKMMFAAMQQNYQQPQVGYDEMQNMISSAVAGLLPTMQQQMQALPPAQSEADDLRAMMEQQQEMLNQLMQNQQTQQDYAAVAQDESVKTIFDTQPETEVVTLEESYGKLGDEEKRYYYEIGGYIMSKPETVQNDGKYAVLFKYRGRTLFKLFIKNNAPILAYVLDNNSQAEMIIDDETALDDAKQIVNMRTKRVDRELDR